MGRVGSAVVAALAVFAAAAESEAADCNVVVRYDQVLRTTVKVEDGKTEPLDSADAIDLRTNRAVCFEVVNTSTAVWAWEVEATEFDTLGQAALGALSAATGAYAVDISRQMKEVAALSETVRPEFQSKRGADKEVRDAYAALQAAIKALNDVLRRVEDLSFRAEATRAQMAVQLTETEALARRFAEDIRSDLRCAGGIEAPDCRKELAILARIAQVHADLQRAGEALAKAAAEAPDVDPDGVGELLDDWKKLRAAFGSALAGVRAADELVRLVAGAKPSWRSRPFRATWQSGYKVAVRARPRKGIEGFAGDPPPPIAATVVRKNAIHLAAGLALVYSPESRFDRYEAIEEGASRRISVAGEDDRTTTPMLQAGMTLESLDWRDTSGWALWLPEVLVTPDASGGFGLGTGVSWRAVKVSGGALWQRQEILTRGQEVGDLLAPGEALGVRRDAFDFAHPRWFVSVSLQFPAP